MGLSDAPIRRTVLDNGLTVVTRELHHAPVTSFWVWYRVGSRNELPGVTGISHWVEHMMFKGTERFPKGAIDRELSRVGGSFNAMTWLDFTAYYATLPTSRRTLALEIEADRMVNASFDPEETEAERTVILSELGMYENYPSFRLARALQAAAFQLHPYRHETIGWESDLRTITRDQLYTHYQTYYTPNNAVAIAVGDFAHAEMVAEIESHFGAIARGPEIPAVEMVEPPQEGERRVTVNGGEPTPILSVAWPAPRATDPDYWPLVVADTLLGGAKGGPMSGAGNSRTSRLYRRLVESGLALAAGSSAIATIDPYLFGIDVTVHPGTDRELVERIVEEEVARLRDEPVSDEALARARKQSRARFAMGLESMSSQGRMLGFSHVVADLDWFARYTERLDAVSADQIQALARQRLTPERRTVGWYLPNGAETG